jgi:uncharacterized membrane protein YkoI
LKSIVAAGAAALALAAGPAFAQDVSPAVTVEDCLASVEAALGGDALHLEYESRGGTPTYEFIIGAGGIEYYVGCDATTGLIGEVDLIVKADDPRWTALAKVDEAAAKKAATERYKGEVEEVKRLLLSNGGAVFEVDVEVDDGDGEFNVYVDAATGSITLVNIEYWEIGRPGVEDDD